MKKQTFALYFGNRGFFPEGLIAGRPGGDVPGGGKGGL